MKRNFGFEPYEGSGKYGFISYKSEEYLTVAKYAKALSDKGVNLWYDYGIPEGEWEDTISEKIVGASFIVLFVSAKMFDSHFIKTEIKTAWKWKIPIIPVFMETIRTSQIAPKDATFFTRIHTLEGVSDVDKMSFEEVADELIKLVVPVMEKDNKSDIEKRITDYEMEKRKKKKTKFNLLNFSQENIIIMFLLLIIFVLIIGIGASGLFRRENDDIVTGETTSGTIESTDSSTTTSTTHEDISSEPLLEVGDTQYMGTYEQDGNTSNGTEPIEWRVLAVENGKVLLITEKLLDYVLYNNENESVTWENCSLRVWLNQTFYKNSFSDSERELILKTNISTQNNPKYDTYGGNSTQDRIFALSIDEVETYFLYDSDRFAYTTTYSRKRGHAGSDSFGNYGTGRWWLRTPGKQSNLVCGIRYDGSIGNVGFDANEETVAVRPAMWIKL